jgi:hypothetical protein
LPLLPNVLHSPTEIVLNPEVLGTLHRRHKRREVLLLTLSQIEPLALNLERLIEQIGHFPLVRRISRQHLGTERLAHLSLIAEQQHPFAFESIVHLTELTHLPIVQIETPTHDFREPFAKLKFQAASLCWLTCTRRQPIRALRGERRGREREAYQ